MWKFFKPTPPPSPQPTQDSFSGPWTPEKHSVGVKALDAQHQELSSLVEHLHRAIAGHQHISEVSDLLRNIVNKAKEHCLYEERLLETNSYPQFEEHQVAHRLWISAIDCLHNDIRTGKLSVQLAPARLETWFSEHISLEDRKYAAFLRRCNVR